MEAIRSAALSHSLPTQSLQDVSSARGNSTGQLAGTEKIAGSERSLSFSAVMESRRSSESLLATGLHSELAAFTSKALSGAKIPPQELIAFQIRAGEFGMRVEMASKIADSLLHTLRKLQQTQ